MNPPNTLTIVPKAPAARPRHGERDRAHLADEVGLGKNTHHSSASEEKASETHKRQALQRRVEMLDKAAWLVHDVRFDDLPLAQRWQHLERIEHCTRHLTYQANGAVLVVNHADESASWANVQRCDSWACPWCGPHKAAEEARRLQVGIAQAQRQGIYTLMITLTLRHKRGDKLAEQIEMLYKAKNGLFSGRYLADLRTRFDLVGHNRYTEITCGASGWHAHLHILWFAGHEFSKKEAAQLAAELTPRWLAKLAKVGAEGIKGVALDVRPANDRVSEYLAKFGHMPARQEWGAANELASAPAKRGRKDSFTPFELLALAAGDPDARTEAFAATFNIPLEQVVWLASDLWREYYDAIKGRQMVAWGDGLLKMFKVEEQVQALDEADEAQLERKIYLRDWSLLRADKALFCAVMIAGADVERVIALLTAAQLNFTVIPPGQGDEY